MSLKNNFNPNLNTQPYHPKASTNSLTASLLLNIGIASEVIIEGTLSAVSAARMLASTILTAIAHATIIAASFTLAALVEFMVIKTWIQKGYDTFSKLFTSSNTKQDNEIIQRLRASKSNFKEWINTGDVKTDRKRRAALLLALVAGGLLFVYGVGVAATMIAALKLSLITMAPILNSVPALLINIIAYTSIAFTIKTFITTSFVHLYPKVKYKIKDLTLSTEEKQIKKEKEAKEEEEEEEEEEKGIVLAAALTPSTAGKTALAAEQSIENPTNPQDKTSTPSTNSCLDILIYSIEKLLDWADKGWCSILMAGHLVAVAIEMVAETLIMGIPKILMIACNVIMEYIIDADYLKTSDNHHCCHTEQENDDSNHVQLTNHQKYWLLAESGLSAFGYSIAAVSIYQGAALAIGLTITGGWAIAIPLLIMATSFASNFCKSIYINSLFLQGKGPEHGDHGVLIPALFFIAFSPLILIEGALQNLKNYNNKDYKWFRPFEARWKKMTAHDHGGQREDQVRVRVEAEVKGEGKDVVRVGIKHKGEGEAEAKSDKINQQAQKDKKYKKAQQITFHQHQHPHIGCQRGCKH